MRLIPFLLATLVIGCNGKTEPVDDTGDTTVDGSDVDGDGYTEEDGDCDDGDATVNPGEAEIYYDGIDQNCDPSDDDDQDGDGYAVVDDCVDDDAMVNPGATEACGDTVDNDCDGEIDEGDTPAYLDADGDGYGTGDAIGNYCDAPEGTASNAEDCDDTNATLHPDADELCNGVDDDCDAEVDEDAIDGTFVYSDTDADGFGDAGTGTLVCGEVEGTVADATDCDDTDALTYPGAPEVCDLEDNDCDGYLDEDLTGDRTYYADADGDGYGDPAVTLASCGATAGYVEDGTDCNDADAATSPGATEVCDGVDNDCDAEVDTDGVDAITEYVDADGDGYGDDATAVVTCTLDAGYVADGGDCDDASTLVSPVQIELCDGFDNNCDGAVDESTASDALTWYIDVDADGYGDPAASAPSCDQPAGFVADATDCDDIFDSVHPGAEEVCDGLDNDCDGSVDSGVTDSGTWYADVDGDGFGDPASAVESCEAPAGYVEDANDCDDTDSAVAPGAVEVCDGVDQDCDGSIDDNPEEGDTYYADTDGDGYGDAGTTTLACEASPGWVADATDCDDTSAGTNPGASEVCDSADNDCDGSVDVGAIDASTWYTDGDSDGYGAAGSTTVSCTAPAGTVATATDCDDTDATVNPGAAEVCDSADNDCDGNVDEGAGGGTYYADADGDGYGDASDSQSACSAPSGYVSNATDCDDGDVSSNPAASEVCDGADNDCDGTVDDGVSGGTTWYVDADGDGFGVDTTTSTSCTQPAGYADNAEDCDDTDSGANPDESEVADAVDNDCDGWVDEDFIGFGDLVITEVDRQPRVGYSSTNTNAQWFEIYNPNTFDIDLSDVYFQRATTTLPADHFYVDPADGVIVPAESYVVLCKTDNFASVSTSYSTMICDYFWGDETASSSYSGTYADNTFNLQRDEDELSIYINGDATTGTLVDSVHWYYDATNGYWPQAATRSMQLDPSTLDATDNDDIDNWCLTTNNVYFQWYYVSAANREYGTPGTQGHSCP